MADIATIVETLSQLTVIEAADLVKKLETAWGVSAAAPVAAAAAAGAAAGAAPAAEAQTTFEVILTAFPADKKIAVINCFIDACEVLIHHAASAERHVPHFGITHLAFW